MCLNSSGLPGSYCISTLPFPPQVWSLRHITKGTCEHWLIEVKIYPSPHIPVILSKALLLSAVRCVLPFTLPEGDDLTLFDISHVCFEQHVYKQQLSFPGQPPSKWISVVNLSR
ncbi:hypothetical protein AVEN_11338-1 [Araneus ventricosus]|uniref:Uncharacterized protein n=1 Tax=Araneus ventricosus TaxID=182803 RepID=A0A4Y2U5D3_ARAVE|nr:hypothetical protein AVEN_11338-1 [Araneus ventricosus]